MRHVVIIGSGIVGLATALKFLRKNPNVKVTIIEKESGPAMHQTGNNSGVIHAGVYYKPGSLKAQNCRKGYQQLIDFCDKENVNYELCGKLIVATKDEELPRLENLYERSIKNGLSKVKKLSQEEISKYEPHASGLAALYVPYTGIVNYAEVAQKFAEVCMRQGAQIKYGSPVEGIIKKSDGVEVVTPSETFEADLFINTAGLYSDKICRMTEIDLPVRIIPFRGEYVALKKEKEHLVKNLIYPVPDPNFPFLGVHFTRMINGGIEAGPNAVWAFAREGYKFSNVNVRNALGDLLWPGFRKVMRQYWRMGLGEYYRSFSKKALEKAMQPLIPEITRNDFVKGGAGVRAQACSRNGGLIDDFLIRENQWSIHVLNAPSPAATASLAIGETVAELAHKRLSYL
ncbi:MAG TPA: L-2-hydroxyglutarate oxidase [Bacteroidales bacterium]|jgi:L-2-hydroxyglutarate oxidase|nr:L-2-hydroxyglutarate oxidase [Bacteroidales bacterium]